MRRAYLIAEIGVNHEGNANTALRMVEQAAQVGCDAVKFQVYDPARLASRAATAYWHGGSGRQRDAFAAVPALTRMDFERLAKACAFLAIDFVATPFHADDLDWLAPLCGRLKVASGDITNYQLLRAVADAGLPVLFSTGGSTVAEAEIAQKTTGGTPLHCVLSYPTRARRANLARIAALRDHLNVPVGYSDHTIGAHEAHTVIQAAYALGATIIEKHYTFDRSVPGNDHYHSFTAADFAWLRRDLDLLADALTDRSEVQECELAGREQARRSVVTRTDITAGMFVTDEMVCMKRPGTGLRALPVGALARVDIPADTVLTREMVA